MKKLIYRLTGGLLIFGASVGLLLNIAALGLVWFGKPAVQSRLFKDLDLIDRTLVSTGELLQTVDHSLVQLEDNRALLESATQNLAAAINDVTPAVDTLSDLIGKDYYDIVTKTQTSLTSIQASAQLIDNTLRIISSFPLIGAHYAPEEPINVTIGNMIQALEPVPPKLTEIGSSLKDSTTNLKNVRSDLEQLSGNLSKMETNISQARQTIQDYQAILQEAEKEAKDIEKNISLWMNFAAIAITLFILWMFVVQIAVFTQGMEIYNQHNRFFKHPNDPT